MILVAGGTGKLGTLVVGLLLAQGQKVRVLSRDPGRAAHVSGEVEILAGDVRDPASLDAAVSGCETVISAVHGFVGADSPSPESIDRDGNRALIRAAKEAGVKHFVLLSVHGAAPDHPMSLHRAKYAAEQKLRALVFGPGRNPINFVSVRDVAALVALSVRDEAVRGETVEIGGPENLNFVTVAERLIESSGKPGRIKHIPLPILRAMTVLARPFSPQFARKARAAVVMNTTDMTFDAPLQDRFPLLPATRLEDLLKPPLAV